MTRSETPACYGSWPSRISADMEQAGTGEAPPAAKARRLRQLAAWYREFAGRAANPVIWESRLLTADQLEGEASRIDPQGDR